MKNNKTTAILWALIFFLILAWIVVGVETVYIIAQTPLGEKLILSKFISATVPAPASASAGENKQDPPAQKLPETCGNTGSLIVLFTGEDFSYGQWPLGADAVRVAKFDFSGKQINTVAFPRDLWVKTPGLAEQNLTETSLGLSYYYIKQATNGSDKHKVTVATSQVAQALYDNFGLAPQYYYTVQLNDTIPMIDTVGGIDIDVPEALTTEYGLYIPAGPQTMDGKTAIEYVRTSVQGDATRLQRQNLFLKALKTKVASANILPKVPDLYKQFDKAIVTDLSPKQINDLACLANTLSQDQITFYDIGGNLVTRRSDGILLPNVDQIKAKLAEWLGE